MQRAAPLEATFQLCDNRPCFELSPAVLSYAFFSKILSRSFIKERRNDQVNRYCCLCLGPRNICAGYVARAASSVRRHDHASPRSVRCWKG